MLPGFVVVQLVSLKEAGKSQWSVFLSFSLFFFKLSLRAALENYSAAMSSRLHTKLIIGYFQPALKSENCHWLCRHVEGSFMFFRIIFKFHLLVFKDFTQRTKRLDREKLM